MLHSWTSRKRGFMGYFYFDESIHPQGHFVLGALAYSETALDGGVADALLRSGLTPGVDEFKSGSRMDRQPAQAEARRLLKGVIQDRCRIGIVIAPDTSGAEFGYEALLGLKKVLLTNRFRSASHEVFFDQGIFTNRVAAELAASRICDGHNCNFHLEQNSIMIMGLQAADLIAHNCAMMMLAQLGIVKKKVKAGPNSGYDPDSEVELEFELWAGLRYNFFAAAPPPVDTWKSQLDFQVDVESRGLHLADSCDNEIRDAALIRFGRMYLGCIH